MLEQIISRGGAGAERAALEAGRAAGLLTGGQSRPGVVTPAVARRLGLALDAGCSGRQAGALNVLRADATLVVGRISDRVRRRLGPRVFRAEWSLYGSADLLADWCRNGRVRVLNVVGGSSPVDAELVARLVWDLARRLGRRPRLPADRCCDLAPVGGRLLAVRVWPTPRAWRWDGSRGWVTQRRWDRVVEPVPPWRLVADTPLARQRAARLAGLLPPAVAAAVVVRGRVDPKLLALAARSPGPVIDLARAGRHGVLRLLAGANDWVTDDRYPDGGRRDHRGAARVGRRVLRRLARGRQRDLIGAFGFPAAESAVRAVAKLPAPVDASALRDLRRALCNPTAAAALGRVRSISEPVLHLATTPAIVRVAAPALWAELSTYRNDCWAVTDVGEELMALSARLRRAAVPAGSVRSLDDIWTILAEPDGEAPPPVPGLTGAIERLTTAAELRSEGAAMAHCVARYGDEVASGWRAVYRVAADPAAGIDRATVMLRPSAGGGWEVDQFAGHANGPVSPATAAAVAAWLAAADFG